MVMAANESRKARYAVHQRQCSPCQIAGTLSVAYIVNDSAVEPMILMMMVGMKYMSKHDPSNARYMWSKSNACQVDYPEHNNGHVIAPYEWWSYRIDNNDSDVQHLEEVHEWNSVWPCVTCIDGCRTNIDYSNSVFYVKAVLASGIASRLSEAHKHEMHLRNRKQLIDLMACSKITSHLNTNL